MRSAVRLAVLLAALLPACGGASPAEKADAAQAAFSAGKYAEARALADEGLAADGAKADKPLAWKLEKVRVESIASLGDKNAEVLPTLARLAGEFPTQVDAQLYALIVNEMNQAGNLLGAIDVVAAGKERFPAMGKAFDDVVKALKKSAENNDAAREKLEQLGYL